MKRSTEEKGRTHTHISKRALIQGLGATALASTVPDPSYSAEPRPANQIWDVIVVGGGNAGLPTAIFAAQRGAKVLIIDAAEQLGGTLHLSSGQMSAAGTKLQKSKGIEDTWQIHYDDVMRLSEGTANPGLLRLAVENNGATFDWLMDHGLTVYPDHPITGTTHEPYSRARYAWGTEGGRSILKILLAAIQPEIDAGRVTVLTNTKASKLLVDGTGAVTGVETQDDDKKIARHNGRNVVLTSGGFGSNPPLYEKIDHVKRYVDVCYPYSKGDGLMLGISVGGYARGGELHTPLFGGILASDDFPSPMLQIFRPWPPSRPPWEIYVNAAGQRFVQEDVPSHHVLEETLIKQPGNKCWMVFDDAIIQKAPQVLDAKKWSAADYQKAFGTRKFFYRADTFQDLSRQAGIDATGLAATIAEYNAAQASGKDRFGRSHMPLPIGKPPYYAIALFGWGFTGYGGLAVDDQLRVIRQDGKPIGNLYAAGEILGTSQTMGHSHAGGMNVTPALTYGRLLGQKMLKFNA